jgi:hypothetical protein
MNKLVNAGFEINNRGGSFVNPVDNQYTLDKWQVQTGGGTPATFTVSQDSSVIHATGKSSVKYDVTNVGSGVTNSLRLQQKFLNYKDFIGLSVYASVWVKTSIVNKIHLVIDLGSATAQFSNYHTGSGNWERLEVPVFTVPSNCDSFRFKFGQMSGNGLVTGTFWADDAVLVIGASAVDYEPFDPSLDESACEAFYEKGGCSSDPLYIYGLGYSDGTNYLLGTPQLFKTKKALVPSVTLNTNHICEDGSGTTVEANYTKQAILVDQDGFTARCYKAVGGSKPGSFSFWWTAEVQE